MKKIAIILLLGSFLISCGESTKKNNDPSASTETSQKVSAEEALPSADYNSLLTNYECNITVSEVAAALNIPEASVSLAKYQQPGRCAFNIKGFGQNPLGDDTLLNWFLEDVGKEQVQKEINTYLDDQANNEDVLGMGIDLSETGDTYIARSPLYGRVIIMNANYDSWLLLSYAPKHMYKSRTPEQHTELGERTIALANYLLKKHKK